MSIEKWQVKKFEDIKHLDENGNEYWLARELQSVLGYAQWRRFCDVIDRAMVSCKLNEQEPKYHFADVGKLVEIGSETKREVNDMRLTRFACYLIVMNGDPRKEAIAHGQMYFAVKTRQQEVQELYNRLDEDGKRLFLRSDIKQKNMLLYEVAKRAGIQTIYEYAAFTDKGYMGLYGGLKASDIAKRKCIGKNKEILDYMGSVELAANLFRITQTEDALTKNNITNKVTAGKIHYRIGREVRGAIERIGGTMPENLPTPEKSIPQLQKEQVRAIKGRKR
ncbi:MAG: DNA damage-inducible protein D [Fibromonadales bacterium]|nr:DNA damage-inducible protein D [Fibromonadales bacterium]